MGDRPKSDITRVQVGTLVSHPPALKVMDLGPMGRVDVTGLTDDEVAALRGRLLDGAVDVHLRRSRADQQVDETAAYARTMIDAASDAAARNAHAELRTTDAGRVRIEVRSNNANLYVLVAIVLGAFVLLAALVLRR